MARIPIGGWKSKLGAAVMAIGGILEVSGEALGGDWGPVLRAFGSACVVLGGALLGVGVAHKLSKMGLE